MKSRLIHFFYSDCIHAAYVKLIIQIKEKLTCATYKKNPLVYTINIWKHFLFQPLLYIAYAVFFNQYFRYYSQFSQLESMLIEVF